MNTLSKLALGAVMAAGIAVSAVPPAQAGVSIGIGIGIPGGYYGGHPGRWCYYHPGACDGYGGPYIEGGYWAAGVIAEPCSQQTRGIARAVPRFFLRCSHARLRRGPVALEAVCRRFCDERIMNRDTW